MPKKKPPAEIAHIEYHRDGSIWAKGQHRDGEVHGYCEWYRKGGTKMRSGHFDRGEKIGEWITHDKHGEVYKVTKIKPKKQIQ